MRTVRPVTLLPCGNNTSQSQEPHARTHAHSHTHMQGHPGHGHIPLSHVPAYTLTPQVNPPAPPRPHEPFTSRTLHSRTLHEPFTYRLSLRQLSEGLLHLSQPLLSHPPRLRRLPAQVAKVIARLFVVANRHVLPHGTRARVDVGVLWHLGLVDVGAGGTHTSTKADDPKTPQNKAQNKGSNEGNNGPC